MRHGQGYHSVKENGHDLRDPQLTEKGETQCRERRDKFGRHDSASYKHLLVVGTDDLTVIGRASGRMTTAKGTTDMRNRF